MFKQLFRLPLLRPSVIHLLKPSAEISCQCRSLVSCARSSIVKRQVTSTRTYATVPEKGSVSEESNDTVPVEDSSEGSTGGKKYVREALQWMCWLLLAGGGAYLYITLEEEQKDREIEQSRIGAPAIGGAFELIDTEGNTVTHETFLGKWVLLYFGFCNCPDICPDQLNKMTEVIDKINAKWNLPKILPIFISVDPKRDTKEHVKHYIKDFHPDMVGLTGNEEQVKQMIKTYRVYCSQGPVDEDGDYIVDHTTVMYLMNDEGGFAEYFSMSKSTDEIVKGMTKVLKKTAMERKAAAS